MTLIGQTLHDALFEIDEAYQFSSLEEEEDSASGDRDERAIEKNKHETPFTLARKAARK